jgi:hypothetical protein
VRPQREVEKRTAYKNRGITEILRQIRRRSAANGEKGKWGNGNLQVRTKYLVQVLISKNRRAVPTERFTDKNPGITEICRSSAKWGKGEVGKWQFTSSN